LIGPVASSPVAVALLNRVQRRAGSQRRCLRL
jgi:hypothetical protein